jgi:hypothetical protein
VTRPFDQLGFGFRSHRSALSWIWLLYRRPREVHAAMDATTPFRAAWSTLSVMWHALPWMLLIAVPGRIVLMAATDAIFVESLFAGKFPLQMLQDAASGAVKAMLESPFPLGIGMMIGASTGATRDHGDPHWRVWVCLVLVLGVSGATVAWLDVAAGFVAFGLAFGLAVGLVSGLAFGLAVSLAVGLSVGLVGGLVFGLGDGLVDRLAFGLAFGLAVGLAGDLVDSLALGFAVVLGLVATFAVGLTAGAGVSLGIGVVASFGVAFSYAIGVGLGLTRVYYLPLHFLWLLPVPHGRIYRWHPVAWDDVCGIAFPRLDRLLIAFVDTDAIAARCEIDRLIRGPSLDGPPAQQHAARSARTTLLAREAATQTRLSRLSECVDALPEGDRGFLTQTAVVREQVDRISRLQTDMDAADRPIFREPAAHLLRTEIDNFRLRVAGYHAPLASEFGKAAEAWLKIADQQWQDARQAVQKAPAPQVFRAGDPVRLNQEAFVFRPQVIGELEKQLTLATGCPGLVIYGRRRLGKSTLLTNLSQFLPDSMYVASMSMQKPDLFTSLDSWCDAVSAAVQQALGPALDDARPQTLRELFDWLGQIDRSLAETGSGQPDTPASPREADATPSVGTSGQGRRASGGSQERRLLLAIDEYEVFDRKIAEGVLPEDLLATIRESIQTHRNITWIFVGSHGVSELTGADWPSYLASVRTLTVPPFTAAETRTLLTDPLKHSPVWEREPEDRPRFEPAFWAGEEGIDAIHAQAAGWPHLVQLIAETAIDRINDEKQKHLDMELLERVFHEAVERGEMVLTLLMQNECTLDGEWEYLTGFRRLDTQPPPQDDAVYESLRRRLLVTEDGDNWKLRVPLMQRWMRTV